MIGSVVGTYGWSHEWGTGQAWIESRSELGLCQGPYLPRLRLPLQVLPHLVLVAAVQILKPLLVGDQRVSALGIR